MVSGTIRGHCPFGVDSVHFFIYGAVFSCVNSFLKHLKFSRNDNYYLFCFIFLLKELISKPGGWNDKNKSSGRGTGGTQ